MEFLDVLFLIVAVLILILTMMQSGKSDGASGTIMGGNRGNYIRIKERGIEKVLSNITLWLGVAFFILAILINSPKF
ncbi:TPA: preprotein translocase subunit SecG [bacterium]|jgi:preprotein translocase subunit SecG|nr:preprotein translocase subunit SecG [bacterium]